MPRGPFGLPRLTTAGPFSRETAEEVKAKWEPCPEGPEERVICETIKALSLKYLEDSSGLRYDPKTLEDLHAGCCDEIAVETVEAAAREGISGVRSVAQFGPAGSGHAWVMFRGKSYDATDPQGVDDANDLWFWEGTGDWDAEEDLMRSDPSEDIGLGD